MKPPSSPARPPAVLGFCPVSSLPGLFWVLFPNILMSASRPHPLRHSLSLAALLKEFLECSACLQFHPSPTSSHCGQNHLSKVSIGRCHPLFGVPVTPRPAVSDLDLSLPGPVQPPRVSGPSLCLARSEPSSSSETCSVTKPSLSGNLLPSWCPCPPPSPGLSCPCGPQSQCCGRVCGGSVCVWEEGLPLPFQRGGVFTP